MDFATTLQFKH